MITWAGSPYACSYTGDGGPATQATLCYPRNVVSDAAGNGVRGTSGDGGPATAASLGGSDFLAYDGVDNICVTDTLAYKIRCVTLSTGIIQGLWHGQSGGGWRRGTLDQRQFLFAHRPGLRAPSWGQPGFIYFRHSERLGPEGGWGDRPRPRSW